MKCLLLEEVTWHEVVSACLYAYAWENKVLQLTFRSGGVYAYYNVPIRIYVGLGKARSKGKYFWRHIRGRYRYQRLEDAW